MAELAAADAEGELPALAGGPDAGLGGDLLGALPAGGVCRGHGSAPSGLGTVQALVAPPDDATALTRLVDPFFLLGGLLFGSSRAAQPDPALGDA